MPTRHGERTLRKTKKRPLIKVNRDESKRKNKNNSRKGNNMADNAVGDSCKLAETDDPDVFKSGTGSVSLTLKSANGNVAFLLKDTDVLDSSGNSVNPTKTPTTLTFNVVAGQTYVVEAEYYIFPTHSTGTLQEDCPGGVVLSQVSAVTNPQQFTIQG
jgi:hypothetical protein